MKIFTFGSGSWGLALSNVLAENKNEIFVYARTKERLNEINFEHRAKKYLDDRKLNENIIATNDLSKINECDLLLISVPSKAINEAISEVNRFINKKIDIVNATKGLEPTTNKRIQEYIKLNFKKEFLGRIASILGPGFAGEVCDHNLTCVNSVSEDFNFAKEIQNLFSNIYFRVYASNDVIGSEYGSSIKNAIAIASGIIKGLGFNENTKAALITRGLTEMTRFGVKNGAKKETFFGLTGIGDLVLTCNSISSRNYSFGYKIGKEKNAKKVIEENDQTIEGLYTIKVIYHLAKEENIDTPIINALYEILFEYKEIKNTVKNLMLRPLKEEKFD